MKVVAQFLLVALLATVGLTACKSKKVGSTDGVPADFSLKVVHTGCRGFCPAYSMEVDAKGAAKYVGTRAVDMLGNYTKTLGAATVAEMAKAVTDAHFWDFDEVYGGEIADAPDITTTVTMNGKTKQVKDIRNAPQALKDLEAKLEELFGKDGWAKQE